MILVDDGTSVIDCVHRPESLPPSPNKQRNAIKSKYERNKTPPPPVDLVPVAYVGTPVRVVGRVTRWHDSRQLKVDVIGLSHHRSTNLRVNNVICSFLALSEPCKSFTDEPLHWRTVQHLHASSYSLPGPFVIPTPAVPPPSSSIPNHNQETHSQGLEHVIPMEEAPPSSPLSSVFSSPTRPPAHPEVRIFLSVLFYQSHSHSNVIQSIQ